MEKNNNFILILSIVIISLVAVSVVLIKERKKIQAKLDEIKATKKQKNIERKKKKFVRKKL